MEIRRFEQQEFVKKQEEQLCKETERKKHEQEEQLKHEQSILWQQHGLCKYCGGKLSGLFTKKCISCGKQK